MRLADVMGLLVGRRDSILRVARSRHAIWVGALFVASAAMAREYDRHWLAADWWHLLLPFGASIAMALVQFALFWARRDRVASDATFGQSFRAFLACFWMTAPLAWAYAIPYERFLSPADAVAANLWTLAVVSILRGIIICRVLQVIADVAFWRALVLSSGLAQIIVAGLAFANLEVLVMDAMGGIRRTPEERVVMFAVGLLVAETVYFGWAVGLAALLQLHAIRSRFSKPDSTSAAPASVTAWLLPCLVTLVLIACLPWTQPPWRRAHEVDTAVSEGRVNDALRLMAAHPRDAFPPDWHPPPDSEDTMLGGKTLVSILQRLGAIPPEAWPRAYYVSELERVYLSNRNGYYPDEIILSVEAVLDHLPEGPALRQRYAEELGSIYARHTMLGLPATRPLDTAATTRSIDR